MRPLAGSLIGLYVALDRVYQAASKEIGLTPQQAHLLCAADWKSPALSELADALYCDKTNITGLVDRVEKQDLVERVPDHDDRRVTRLALTEKGREAVDQFHAALNRRLISAETVAAVDPELVKLIAHHLYGAED
jgi:DNA-binding MarR family transcriptional regulator